MRDIGPGYSQNLRIAFEMAACELWQLPVVSCRKVFERLLDMLLGRMEIVDQPFRCRRYGLSAGDNIEQNFMRIVQCVEVLPDADQQRLGRGEAFDDGLVCGKAFGMLPHPEDTEYLGPDRSIVLPAGLIFRVLQTRQQITHLYRHACCPEVVEDLTMAGTKRRKKENVPQLK